MPDTTMAESNFLVPNGTILFEILAFAIVMFILAKYVIPPVNKGLTDAPGEHPPAVRRRRKGQGGR